MEIMIFFLVPATIFDIRQRKIPNLLTAGMFVCLVAITFFSEGGMATGMLLIRVLGMALFLYPVFAIGALGAGDVKLLAVCTGFLPGIRGLYFLFFALLAGTVLGIIKITYEGGIRKRIQSLVLYIGQTLKTGKPGRYHCSEEAAKKAGVPLAGPMLISALIGLGGIY